MQSPGWISRAFCVVTKKAISKGFIVYDSTYVTFFKKDKTIEIEDKLI